MPRSVFMLLVIGAAACASPASDTTSSRYGMTGEAENDATASAGEPAPLDPTRPITVRDCSKRIDEGGGNLSCR